MQLIVMVGYSKKEQEALNTIFTREQLANAIHYPDHEERHYLITAEQLPHIRKQLRDAEIIRAWLTR